MKKIGVLGADKMRKTLAAIYNKNIILSRHYVSPNVLFEQTLTQLMACQGFPHFIGTKS